MRLIASLLALATTGVTAPATVETPPLAHSAIAAGDVALWVHPTERRRSIVIGTDQKGPLETYDLSGKRLQRITSVYPTGVDVRGDLVVASSGRALRVYSVGRTTRRLTQRSVVPTSIAPFGVCLYRSAESRKLYAFGTSITGRVEQWELAGNGRAAKPVRQWQAGTRVDSCVADDASGAIYLSEQRFGIWRYLAEPAAGLRRTLVDRAKTLYGGFNGHVTASVEGLAIAGNRLYASSQGSTDFVAYNLRSNAYVGRFRVDNSHKVDGCQDTVGIEASSRSFGPRFPHGLFICQDGYNLKGSTVQRENYKFAPLRSALP
jgi:3-phytase